MIQRIQTVYLFFAFCLMAVLVFIPFSSSLTVSFGAGLIAALTVVDIFIYKNRSLQIKTGYVLLLLLVLLYVLYFIFYSQSLPIVELFRNIRFTIVFPFIAFIFVLLAIRGIKKDEKLVRSLDRIR